MLTTRISPVSKTTEQEKPVCYCQTTTFGRLPSLLTDHKPLSSSLTASNDLQPHAESGFGRFDLSILLVLLVLCLKPWRRRRGVRLRSKKQQLTDSKAALRHRVIV